jgi:hypothetical protein
LWFIFDIPRNRFRILERVCLLFKGKISWPQPVKNVLKKHPNNPLCKEV